MTRRSFLVRNVKNYQVVLNILIRSVAGFGILLLPVFSMWFITIWQADLPSRAEAQRLYADHQTMSQNIASTSTAISTNIITGTYDNRRNGSIRGDDGIWDKTDAVGWAIFVSILVQGLLVFALYTMFWLLIPILYPDMDKTELNFSNNINENAFLLSDNQFLPIHIDKE